MVEKDMMPINTVDNHAEKLKGAVESWGLTGRVMVCVCTNHSHRHCPDKLSISSQPGAGSMYTKVVNDRLAGQTVNRVHM